MTHMIPLIEDRLDLLRSVCRHHGVAQLEVFGSATEPGRFDAQSSDVDFIVSFHVGVDLGPWLAEYFALRDELQQALGRRVELVMASAMRNPLFRQEADRSRQLVYATKDTEAA